MILSSARKIGPQASRYAGRHADVYEAVAGDGDAIKPVEPTSPRPMFQERRSAEALANAQALHLGIAAQMWSTQPERDKAGMLPLPPVARTAARYASMAQGPQSASMGFARTA